MTRAAARFTLSDFGPFGLGICAALKGRAVAVNTGAGACVVTAVPAWLGAVVNSDTRKNQLGGQLRVKMTGVIQMFGDLVTALAGHGPGDVAAEHVCGVGANA